MAIQVLRLNPANTTISVATNGVVCLRLSEDDAMKLADALRSIALSKSKAATITPEDSKRGAVLTLR